MIAADISPLISGDSTEAIILGIFMFGMALGTKLRTAFDED